MWVKLVKILRCKHAVGEIVNGLRILVFKEVGVDCLLASLTLQRAVCLTSISPHTGSSASFICMLRNASLSFYGTM